MHIYGLKKRGKHRDLFGYSDLNTQSEWKQASKAIIRRISGGELKLEQVEVKVLSKTEAEIGFCWGDIMVLATELQGDKKQERRRWSNEWARR